MFVHCRALLTALCLLAIAPVALACVEPCECDPCGCSDCNTHGAGIAEPPTGRFSAGQFASQNVVLLAHMPLSEIGGEGRGVLGNDCWGWTDPLTGKEYALFGRTNGTSLIDISDPASPVYLGDLPGAGSGNEAWRDIKVYQNHAYIVADGFLNRSHGMQVFDLTLLRDVTAPTTFTATARYTGFGNAHNLAINTDSGHAYAVSSNTFRGGPHIVDLQDPLSLVFAGGFSGDGYTHDTQVVNYQGPDTGYVGREVAFCSNEDTLTILDVTDKASPAMLSRTGYPQAAYSHQGWLTEDQRYFLMDDELDESRFATNTRTHIWDVSDLNRPQYKGFYTGPVRTTDHNLYIKDGLAYEANYASGLRVVKADCRRTARTRRFEGTDEQPRSRL